MFLFVYVLVFGLLVPDSRGTSSIITFPTSFTSSEGEKINPLDVKKCYQKGIDAVQSVAGLVQNILLQESVDFGSQSWIISPVSLAGVFAQLLMGSRGEIRQTLSNALSLSYDDKNFTKLDVHRQLGDLLNYLKHSGTDDYTLLLNSVVFLQAGFPLKATYKHALWDFYRTPILPIDFMAKSSVSIHKINEWVKNSTGNRFSDLMSLPLSPNTVSILANIVYFKGNWELPFDPDYTQPGWFFVDSNQKVHVDYMYGEQEVLYGNTSDYQLIGLPYKSRDVVLYILLPNGKFSSRIALKQFDAMASSARLENVTLVLPKFKLTTTISVKDAITKYLRKNYVQSHYSYGRLRKKSSLNKVESISNARLSQRDSKSSNGEYFDMGGASEDVRFKIDDILHKVILQVDELGTELMAATSTLVDHTSNELILKVNRPFLFFVRQEIAQAHLFWGFVTNPGESVTKTSKEVSATEKLFKFDSSKSTKGASKLRRDLINAEISNLRDLLPLPPSTRQRLSQLQLMALVCVYVRKANYFQQVFKRHESNHHHVPTPNIGFSKALNGFLMMMTQNGKLLYISDNAAEYLGHSMEDLLIHGDSVYDIIDKQDHQAIQTELVRNSTSPTDDDRMFLCRMNVSRNARRQMRFGDQKMFLPCDILVGQSHPSIEPHDPDLEKRQFRCDGIGRLINHVGEKPDEEKRWILNRVVLVQGHYLSFLPLCSRNEPVFLATCTPVAMPETRECVVQGATNVFTSIHSMDMKFIHIDKNGEFHLGFPRSELQGASWYQLLHWESMREAQSKHRLITQSEQDRSCILLLRLQKRSGDWLWVHCVLQVKDNMENSQQPVIVCTNQVLSEKEAAVMLTNGWLYHYYMVQSKLQYGLAYEAATATRMVAAAAYYHPHAQHPQAMSAYPHHIGHQHLDSSHHHSYLQHHMSPAMQHVHSHNGSTPSHHQMHLSPNENHNSSPGYVLPQETNFRNERRLDPDSTPVDYSVHSHSEMHDRTNVPDHYHQDHNQNHISHDENRSPPVIQHTSHKRRGVKVESVKSESSPRVSPNSEVIVDLDRNGGGIYANGGGGGPLMLATTPVPLHSFARPRVLIKGGMVDPAEFIEQWNPSPPWSDTTVQKVPDIIHQDLSPYVTTTPPTPTGTPSSLSVGSLSHQPPHSAFTFDWAPEQYVPTLQHPRAVPLADEEPTMAATWPLEHRLFPLQPPPPPRLLQPTPILKMEQDAESSARKDSIRDRSNNL